MPYNKKKKVRKAAEPVTVDRGTVSVTVGTFVPIKKKVKKKQEARDRRWRKTGVSPQTLSWMRTRGML